MANTFRSLFPTVRCYTYLASTGLGVAYIASLASKHLGRGFGGLGILPMLGLETVIVLGLKYYLAPMMIKSKYSIEYNAKEVGQFDVTYQAAQAIKDAVKKDGWNDVKVYEYDDGEANAFAIGMTKDTAAVYVSKTLVTTLNEYKRKNSSDSPEAKEMLKAIIAHEFGHITGRHSWIGYLSRSMVLMIDALDGYVALIQKATEEEAKKKQAKAAKQKSHKKGKENKDKSQESDNSMVKFYAARLASILFKFFGVSAVSRQNEYMADNFAVSLGYGKALAHGLLAIHGNKPSDLEKPKGMGMTILTLLSETFSTHPSTENRIIAISEAQNEMTQKKEITLSSWCSGVINASFLEYISHNQGLGNDYINSIA